MVADCEKRHVPGKQYAIEGRNGRTGGCGSEWPVRSAIVGFVTALIVPAGLVVSEAGEVGQMVTGRYSRPALAAR